MVDEKQPLLKRPEAQELNIFSNDLSDTSGTENEQVNERCRTFRIPIYGTNGGPSSRIVPPDERLTYSWSNMNVFVTTSPEGKRWFSWCRKTSKKNLENKHILKNVCGIAYPGELLAIMGSSGAGKTTLLNALTFRTSRKSTVTGVRCVNGIPVSYRSLTSQSAYVQQDDLFIGSLTVREHLVFQALVRMDKHISYEQRLRRVEEVLQEFALLKCENTVIGIPGRVKGISGGERKRLSFAAEVLTNPRLMFCDEPTSGLDSFMALNVVQNLKNLALSGKTVICTIHQPSSELYAMFDKLLLMSEGRVAFIGTPEEADGFFAKYNVDVNDGLEVFRPINKDVYEDCYWGQIDPALRQKVNAAGNKVIEIVYTYSLSVPCPTNFNPADYFIQLLAVAPGREEACRKEINHICDKFEHSDIGVRLASDAAAKKSSDETQFGDIFINGAGYKNPYKASWIAQFRAVLWRSWTSILKEPLLIKVRILQSMMVACLIGLIYYGQSLTQDGVMNINGALFIFITNMTFQNVFAVISVFCSELPVFLREHRNGMYRTDVYFICKTLAETPLFIFIPVIFVSIAYFLIGLNGDIARYCIACGIIVLVTQVATSFGYFISCVSTSISMALTLAPTLIIPFLLFGGFFLNVGSIPRYLEWLSYFSWFKYGNEALLINQWRGVDGIECNAVNSTCPRNGHIILEIYNFHEDNFNFDIIYLFGLIVFFRLLGFLALLRKSYSVD